jgi:hypothetical protein
MFEKSVTILAHVVIFRAFPETVRVFVVMTKGDGRSLRELFSAEPWSVRCSHAMDKDAGRSAGCNSNNAKRLRRIQSQRTSFPHVFSGNLGWTETGPPIKTFGGDAFRINLIEMICCPVACCGGAYLSTGCATCRYLCAPLKTTPRDSVEDSTGLGVRFQPIPTRAWEKLLEGLVGGKS